MLRWQKYMFLFKRLSVSLINATESFQSNVATPIDSCGDERVIRIQRKLKKSHCLRKMGLEVEVLK